MTWTDGFVCYQFAHSMCTDSLHEWTLMHIAHNGETVETVRLSMFISYHCRQKHGHAKLNLFLLCSKQTLS